MMSENDKSKKRFHDYVFCKNIFTKMFLKIRLKSTKNQLEITKKWVDS